MPIIYMMTCKDLTKIYIGSTVNTKEVRLAKHKNSYNRWKNGKTRGCGSFDLFEIGDVEIHIILECPDDISNLELRQLEQIYIDNCECVNIKKSYQNKEQLKSYQKEYQKEYHKEYQKEYQQSEKYKEYQKQYRESKKLKTI